jgi:hypothetical protein
MLDAHQRMREPGADDPRSRRSAAARTAPYRITARPSARARRRAAPDRHGAIVDGYPTPRARRRRRRRGDAQEATRWCAPPSRRPEAIQAGVRATPTCRPRPPWRPAKASNSAMDSGTGWGSRSTRRRPVAEARPDARGRRRGHGRARRLSPGRFVRIEDLSRSPMTAAAIPELPEGPARRGPASRDRATRGVQPGSRVGRRRRSVRSSPDVGESTISTGECRWRRG